MLNLNDQNFEAEIKKIGKPVLVDFWADWCFPCQTLNPILDEAIEELKNDIVLAKVNIDEAPIISQKYGIEKVPTIFLFKEGKPKSFFEGIRSEDEIKDWLNKNLKNE